MKTMFFIFPLDMHTEVAPVCHIKKFGLSADTLVECTVHPNGFKLL